MADEDADPETLYALVVHKGESYPNRCRYSIIAEYSDPAGTLLETEATDDPLSLRLNRIEEEADKNDWQDLDQHILYDGVI